MIAIDDLRITKGELIDEAIMFEKFLEVTIVFYFLACLCLAVILFKLTVK